MNREKAPPSIDGPSASLALAIAASIMLLAANLLPILTTESSGKTRNDTILSGTIELWRHGLGAIAAIVFTASILIPILKIAGLGWLLIKSREAAPEDSRRLTRVYAAIDFIGRWSMLDVFLVTFLAGLVQFGGYSTVTPRSGIVAFAAAVVLTVFATQAFDPRVLWRNSPYVQS